MVKLKFKFFQNLSSKVICHNVQMVCVCGWGGGGGVLITSEGNGMKS